MKRTGPTNIHLRRLIHTLRKAAREHHAPVWRRVAELLEKPTRSRIEVNLSRINRHAEDGEVVVVPGKVLGSGVLEKRVVVAAWSFSADASKKISKVGRAVTIESLLRENPGGKGVKIIA